MANFADAYATHYDSFYAQKDYRAECDLIERAAGLHGGGSSISTVLDVGCGTGGHAIELASRGYGVTGVDLSTAMLDRAVAKASSLDSSRRPAFRHGDVRDFDAGREHDLAIMMFAVIGYLTDNADVLAGLRNVRRHLRVGGLFLCDFWYGPSVLAVRPTDRIRVLRDGENCVIRAASTSMDPIHHCADVTIQLWTLHADRLIGETTESHRLRYFFPQEFRLMLSTSGFEPITLSAFPTLDGELRDETWNAFAVARAC
ncbi:MAG: class I SAM-dependent methyltransferase [Burkholderiaceae bacterium]